MVINKPQTVRYQAAIVDYNTMTSGNLTVDIVSLDNPCSNLA